MELEFELLKRQHPNGDSDQRCCEWPECEAEAAHRAPKSRNELNTYRWFCTAHAREYNRSWNYYAGMSDAEVEADVRQGTVWHRPTWRLGSNDTANPDFSAYAHIIKGPFDILKTAQASSSQRPVDPGFTAEQRRALAVFDLERPGDVETIKQRYKELLKRYHPDAKGATAASAAQIKAVNAAYNTLMKFGNRY